MKFFNLKTRLAHTIILWRKILCCFALLLFCSAACTPAEKPVEKSYEMMWWNDLHVQVKPIKDKNKATFAIWLALTNRSLKDTAIVKRRAKLEQSFFLSIGTPAAFEKQKSGTPLLQTIELTIDPVTDPLPDSSGSLTAPVLTEIEPGHHLGFCLKLEDYILPNQTIATDTEKHIVLLFITALAWRRSTGLTTPFGIEKYTDYKVIPTIDNPRFDFGDQKIMIHRNLACEDAGK